MTKLRRATVSSRRNPAHLLIVEDDRAVQEVIELLLVEEGYQVESAQRPETAVEALRHVRFDLVLTDLFGITPAAGLAAVLPVLRAARSTPVGLCTGYPLNAETARAAGFAFIVPKPFEIEMLLTEIAGTLARHDALLQANGDSPPHQHSTDSEAAP
jgi:CheY-like chemotaxis protein